MLNSLKKKKKFLNVIKYFYKNKKNDLFQINFQNFVISMSQCLVNNEINYKPKEDTIRSKFSILKYCLIYFPFKKIIVFRNANLQSKYFFIYMLLKGYHLVDFSMIKVLKKKEKIKFSVKEISLLKNKFMKKSQLLKLLNHKFLNYELDINPKNIHLIVTGSLHPLNHFFIKKMKKFKIPTVLIHHGLNSGFLDEPPTGYSENSSVDNIIYYGNAMKRLRKRKATLLLDKFTNKSSRSYYCSNELIFKSYNNNLAKSFDRLKYLYVATELNKDSFYLPFSRILPSEQTRISKFYKNILTNLHLAPHPNCLNFSLKNNFKHKIEENWKKNISNYDFLVFDYWSTAIIDALYTNKPIIYFDHNIRNFTIEGLEFLKRRTLYINVKEMNKIGKIRKLINNKIKNYNSRNYKRMIEFYFPQTLETKEKQLIQILKN